MAGLRGGRGTADMVRGVRSLCVESMTPIPGQRTLLRLRMAGTLQRPQGAPAAGQDDPELPTVDFGPSLRTGAVKWGPRLPIAASTRADVRMVCEHRSSGVASFKLAAEHHLRFFRDALIQQGCERLAPSITLVCPSIWMAGNGKPAPRGKSGGSSDDEPEA